MVFAALTHTGRASASAPKCDVRACIDLRQEAGFYAQLSALMAGFAVAALTVILTVRVSGQSIRQREEDDQTALAFFASIVGLTASCLIATEVASSTAGSGRTATGSNLVGACLATSGIALFHAVTLALRHADLPEANRLGRWVSGLAIPLAAFQFMGLGSGQVDVERRQAGNTPANSSDFAFAALGLLALILIVSLVVNRRFALESYLRFAPTVTCVATLGFLLVEGLLMTQPMSFTPPIWADYAAIAATGVLFGYLGIAAGRTSPLARENGSPS
jgi:hypothetical protein